MFSFGGRGLGGGVGGGGWQLELFHGKQSW